MKKLLIIFILCTAHLANATDLEFLYTPKVDYATSCQGGPVIVGGGWLTNGTATIASIASTLGMAGYVTCSTGVDPDWLSDYEINRDGSALLAWVGTPVIGSTLQMKTFNRGLVDFTMRMPCADHTGETTTILYKTTIGAYADGVLTPDSYPPADLCAGKCQVERNYSTPLQAGVLSGTTPTIGGDVYLFTEVTVTPTVCTTGTSGVAAPPDGELVTPDGDPVGGGEGESDSTLGKLGKPYTESTYCIDQDADGLDDEDGETCVLKAEREALANADAKKGEFEAIGSGGTLAGDVLTLSGNNGGWFTIPASILSFLNPPASCNIGFRVPAVGAFGGDTITVTRWCDLKTDIEPYLAFGMYVLTLFVAYSQFKRV